MRWRLTRQADGDIEGILRDTLLLFGERQVLGYAQTLSRALELIADDPDRASARRRDDIRPGVRSFHIALADRRRSAAAHLAYFIKASSPEVGDEIIILRVLHERMEPRRRVLEGLRDLSAAADPEA